MNHDHCTTCGRSTAACAECKQPWPDGEPGWHDANGWHNGVRPAASRTRPPEVVKAEKKAEDAQARFDAARANWEAAASQHYTIRHRSRTEGTTIIGADGALRDVSPVSATEIRHLAAAEESAREVMAAVGTELVEARAAHREATRAARAAA